MSRPLHTLLALMTLLLPATGCMGGDKPAGGGKADASADAKAAAAEAQKVWKMRCVACHGDQGKGDGVGAAALEPKPRAFSDPSWKADDERIKQVILGGGAAVGLSPLMTPNPDLANKPAVVHELVKIVKSMR